MNKNLENLEKKDYSCSLEINYNVKILDRLRHFIIPSKCNDYKPSGLKPKRLFFYALSSIVMKVIVLITMILIPSAAWLNQDVLISQRTKIINLTNEVRDKLNIKPLTENALLNEAAYAKANDMLYNQYFSHTNLNGKKLDYWLKQSNYEYSAAGENLAMGFINAESVINGWMKSETHRANIIDPNFSDVGIGIVSGQYNNRDSVLIVQYFGLPKNSGESSVLEVENIIDNDKSKVTITNTDNKSILEAKVYFLETVKNAELNFNEYNTKLTEIGGAWVGSIEILKDNNDKKSQNLFFLANVKAFKSDGLVISNDIEWQNISPVKHSFFDKYSLSKAYNTYLQPMFQLSSLYYTSLIFIIFTLLMINIFVEIKKQHPQIIFSSVGVLSVLLLLLYF